LVKATVIFGEILCGEQLQSEIRWCRVLHYCNRSGI